MNKVITIPKGEFVLVPREEYEAFSGWKRAVKVKLEDEWFWTPEWQKKEAEADVSIRAGKITGPFLNHKDLIAALRKNRK